MGYDIHSIQFKKLWQFLIALNWFLSNNSYTHYFGSVLSHFLQVLGHAFLASVLWKHAKSLDLTSQSAFKSFYMFIWKVETTTYYSLYAVPTTNVPQPLVHLLILHCPSFFQQLFYAEYLLIPLLRWRKTNIYTAKSCNLESWHWIMYVCQRFPVRFSECYLDRSLATEVGRWMVGCK